MIAIDTNILVHAHQREAVLHSIAVQTIRDLAESPTPWAICFHSLVEFYGVVTHKKIWREPSVPKQATDQISAWRESPSLRLLTDREDVMDQMIDLAQRASVSGGQIHDTRIAACCITHGVRELWTVDRDFSRYPDLKTYNPLLA